MSCGGGRGAERGSVSFGAHTIFECCFFCRCRGYAFSVKRDYDKAIADYGEAVRLEPRNAAAFCNRGTVFHAKGDYGRAAADLTEALKIDPSDDDAKKALEAAKKRAG
ncbi:MAG: tetratricopeptide repeat protein [Spirochaetales bacterium]|nr:tetratricopeptide repeat protein [Spirochaetales bacterium]